MYSICLVAHFCFIYRFFTTVYLWHRWCQRALDPRSIKHLFWERCHFLLPCAQWSHFVLGHLGDGRARRRAVAGQGAELPGGADLRLRWEQLERGSGGMSRRTHAVRPDVGFSAHKSTLVWATKKLRLFLGVEIRAKEQDGLDRPREFQRSPPNRCFVVGKLWHSEGWTASLCLFQYGPLPLFFAEDQLSFYKVMSDARGYKHIHLVKDVCKMCVCHVWSLKNESRAAAVQVCCIHQGLLVKGKASPVTSGKWEVIYIAKLTKDAMWVLRMSRRE